MTAKLIKASKPEDILEQFLKPAIANVIVDGILEHYVVIYKVRKDYIKVADPLKGMVKYSLEEFYKIWTGYLIVTIPGQEFEKGNYDKNSINKFLKLLIPQKKLVINIIMSSLVLTILGILATFYYKFLVDDILVNNLKDNLTKISLGMIFLVTVQTIISVLRAELELYLGQKIDIPLLLGTYKHLIDLPISFFERHEAGDIISRINCASDVREVVCNTAISVVMDSIMAIAGAFILYRQNKDMFLICLIPLILYAILVALVIKPLNKKNKALQEAGAELSSYTIECINGIEVIKSLNLQNKSKITLETKFVKALKKIFTLGTFGNAVSGINGLIESIFGICILWIGAVKVINGELSIGELLVFNSLMGYFLSPIENLINMQGSIQTAVVSIDRLNEIIESDKEFSDEEKNKINPEELKGDIELKNVTFAYGTRKPTLVDFNLKINGGEKVALVGESGCGKSTIIKLIMGFYNVNKGQVLINDINVLDIYRECLRDKISYVSQEVKLFAGSIYENIALGDEYATLSDVVEVCKKVHLNDYIKELPMRYNTFIEEGGSNLSGGQKQRIAIARALLKNPDIIIFDEITSNLDALTAAHIEEIIEELRSNCTIIMISHNLKSVLNCDKIVLIEKGNIIAYDSHEKLYKENKKYREMIESQLGGVCINE